MSSPDFLFCRMNFRLGGEEEACNSDRPMSADKILRTRGGLAQPKNQEKGSLTSQKLLDNNLSTLIKHHRILLSHKREFIWLCSKEVDEPRAYYIETEKDKYHILTHIYGI